jgi:hypothetical protein
VQAGVCKRERSILEGGIGTAVKRDEDFMKKQGKPGTPERNKYETDLYKRHHPHKKKKKVKRGKL